MDLWIEHACEPERLLLCWEAPVTQKDRNRWVVGAVEKVGETVVFRYMVDAEFLALNFGRTREQLKEAGYLGYPAFNEDRSVTFDDGVQEAFMRRLPPRNRSDFPSYLAQFRLRLGSVNSDFALLGSTEARLPSDGFSLINPLNPESGPCEVLVEIAGHRHYGDEPLSFGDLLQLRPDPTNAYDCNAIRFEAEGRLAGHVSRFQAPTILTWLAHGQVSAKVARLNGTSERPKAFAILRYQPAKERAAA
jgi:hypothetical protein